MNSQLNATNAETTTANIVESPALKWFADPDGVYRCYEDDEADVGFVISYRASVELDNGDYFWFAWGKTDSQTASGWNATLELAKAAAERAVAQMDGEP